MNCTTIISQLWHCSNQHIAILTPKSAGGIIIPTHQVKRGFPLLGQSLGCMAKIEWDCHFGRECWHHVFTDKEVIPSFSAIISLIFWTRRIPALAFLCLLPHHWNLFFLKISSVSYSIQGSGMYRWFSSDSSSVKSPSNNC